MNSWNTFDTDTLIQLLRKRLLPVEESEQFFMRDPQAYAHVRRSAVLLPLFEEEDALSLLFIRRASTLRTHSGEIAFPGGKVEASDSSVVAAAIREAYEEVRLEPERVQVLGLLPPVLTVASNYVITPVVAYLPGGTGQLLAQESEVAELRESRSRPDAGIVTFAHRLLNQRDEIVCQCLRSALLRKSPA